MAQARSGDQESEAITYGDVFKAAAQANERAGLVSKDDDTIAAAQGMMVKEYVGGQPSPAPHAASAASYVTIGEALEAAALRTWDKPVEQSDAAAIQSAERWATGTPETLPGGVAAAAQSAANVNPRLPYEERTTLADILFTASEDLPADKAVIMEDAQKIKESEARQSMSGQVFPGGVGDAMEAAARINERGSLNRVAR